MTLVALLIGEAASVPLTGTTTTTIAAVALLGFGLPHGALDIKMLQRHARYGLAGLFSLLLLYVGVAALTLIAWIETPLIGLALFLGTAIKHFADDWRVSRSIFLAYAMGTALLAAPVLTHGADVRWIFMNITADASGAIFADLLLMTAPVLLLVGLVALGLLWALGEHDQAVGGGLSLIALLTLPPVLGFALFFCLFHSPLHFHRKGELGFGQGHRTTAAWVAILTIAALGLTLAIYVLDTRGALETRSVSASFMTLAVLTMPHLLVPRILALRASQGTRQLRADTVVVADDRTKGWPDGD